MFWYGLGIFHPLVRELEMSYYTYFLLFLMPLIVLFSYYLPLKISFQYPKYLNYEKKEGLVFLIISLSIVYMGVLYLSGMPRYHLIRVLVTFAIFLASIFLLTKNLKLKFFTFFFFFLIVDFVLLDLYTRRALLGAIFPFIYYIFLKLITNRNSNIKIIILVILTFVVFFIFTAYRSSSLEEIQFLDLFQIALDLILIGSGFDTIFLTQYVVSHFDMNNFLYGESFLAGLLNIIPRELWTDKPIAFSMTLSAMYYNIPIDDIFTNFGPGILAEAYANGGFIFVIIVSFILGIALRLYDRWNSISLFSFKRFGVSSIVFPSLFFLVRGDFVNSFYEFYFKLIFFLLLTYFFRKYTLK